MRQHFPMLQKQRDQQTPDSSIAVEIRMDGFKLHVCDAGPRQRRDCCITMQELLQIAEQFRQLAGWRGYKRRIAGARPADPVLGLSHLSRGLAGAANSAHESLV